MNKDDKLINKTLSYQLKQAADMSNNIYMSFKKLYFDLRKHHNDENLLNQPSFNSLTRPVLQKLVDMCIIRFKNIPNNEDNERINYKSIEDYPIIIDQELKSFLKSCGNKLSDDEIEFMLHLIENIDTFKNGTVTCKQFYSIWGAIIHFSTKKPEEIIEYVFEKFYEDRPQLDGLKQMDIPKVDEFFRWYSEYFPVEQINFIRNEVIL